MTGQDIIAAVMSQHRIGPKDFFGQSPSPHIVSARRAAIVRLRRDGTRIKEIARLIQRDSSTVRYWLEPRDRAQRTAYKVSRRALAQVRA